MSQRVWGENAWGELEGLQAWKARALSLKPTGWPTDLQASDGKEAPCTHQHVAGAAEVSPGETLLPSGKTGEEESHWLPLPTPSPDTW